MLFVVTNYDWLLEEAFEEAGIEYDLVVYPSTADHPADGASVMSLRHGESTPRFVHQNTCRRAVGIISGLFKCPADTPPPKGKHCESVAGSTAHGKGLLSKTTGSPDYSSTRR